jgi:hypothetical protein
MRVTVHAAIRPTRHGGALAPCKELRLTGGGRTQAEAVASLRRGVTAWCAGLQRQHALDNALERHGIQWAADDGPLVVEVTRVQDGSSHGT